MREQERCRRRVAVLVAVALIAFVSYEWSCQVKPASAIPAFARKYNFACNVCHVPGFPKLNDFGNIFRDQGYQMGGANDLPEHESIGMGYWPVSLRTQVGYQTTTIGVDGAKGSGGNSDVTTGGFGFSTFNLLSFGLLAKNVTFGIIFAPAVTSGKFGTGQVQGDLPDAFVRLDNLERFFGITDPNSYLMNLKIGKYEPELPFSAFRNPTQFTNPIVMYNYTAGTPYTAVLTRPNTVSAGYSNADTVSIQRGNPGVELAGIKRTDWSDGYFRYSLNGFTNNTPPVTTAGGGREMYFYGHVTQSFGGYGIVSGHRVGLSWWQGNVPTTANTLCTGGCQGAAGNGHGFSKFGVDLSTTYDGQWNLFGAWIHAVDNRALFSSQGVANPQTARWNGAFVELDWYPNALPFFGTPGWLFLYRYDLIRNEQQGSANFARNYNDVDSQTLMARYYFHFSSRTDIALHLAYNRFVTQGVGTNGNDLLGQLFFAGFDFAL